MKTIIPVVLSLSVPLLSSAAMAETKSPDDLKKCADLQAQKDSASKVHNPLLSQIRLQHIEALMAALECPEPEPATPIVSHPGAEKAFGPKASGS